MTLTTDRAQRIGSQSEEILEKSLERLRQMRIGALPSDTARLNAEIASTQTRLNTLKVVNTRLRAADVVIQPLPDDKAAELDALADKIDQAIRDDAAFNAGLDTALDLIKLASRGGELLSGATGTASGFGGTHGSGPGPFE